MASQAKLVVEMTSDEKRLLDGFRRSQAADDDFRAGLKKTGTEMDSTGKAMVDAMLGAAKSTEVATDKIVKQLRGAGSEGRKMADAVSQHLQTTGKAGRQNADSLLTKLRAVDGEAAQAAEKVLSELKQAEAKAEREVEFNGLLNNLRAIGNEGATAASRINQELKFAADKSADDFNAVLAKIVEMEPAAAGAADKIKAEMAEAAKYSEGQFADVLDELRRIGPEGTKVARELKTELVAAGKLSEKGIDDIIAKLHKIDPAAAASASAIKNNISNAASQSDTAFQKFGKSATSQLAGVAGAYVGVHEAIQKVIELNREVLQTNKEAFASVEKTQSGDKRLLQVSTSGADFKRLQEKSDSLAKTYGIDREQARQLVFSGRSEKFEGSLDFIGSRAEVIDIGSQAIVAGQLPELFKGSGKRLTPEQAINVVAAGATESRLDFEKIAGALPQAAEGTALIGSDASETTAALSVLASRFGSAERAADRIKAFAAKANLDSRLDGRGLLGAAQALGKFSDEDRKKFLGESTELNTAYEFLQKDFAEIVDRKKITDSAIRSTGTSYSPTEIKLQSAKESPRLQALFRANKAKINLEIEREKRRAVSEGTRQERTDRELARAEIDGVASFQIEAAEQLGEGVAGFGGDSSEVVALATSNTLANLERDFRIATRAGDDSVGASLLAVRDLRKQRQTDSSALLSPDAAAQLFRQSTGEFVSPIDITLKQRAFATSTIERQARQAAGFGRTVSESVFRGFEGSDVPFLGAAANAAAAQGSDASAQILAELRRSNQLMEEQLGVTKETATNTKPNQRRPTDAQREAAQAADRRRNQ